MYWNPILIKYYVDHTLAIDGSNEPQKCMLRGASYVKMVVHAINDHFPKFQY